MDLLWILTGYNMDILLIQSGSETLVTHSCP